MFKKCIYFKCFFFLWQWWLILSFYCSYSQVLFLLFSFSNFMCFCLIILVLPCSCEGSIYHFCSTFRFKFYNFMKIVFPIKISLVRGIMSHTFLWSCKLNCLTMTCGINILHYFLQICFEIMYINNWLDLWWFLVSSP